MNNSDIININLRKIVQVKKEKIRASFKCAFKALKISVFLLYMKTERVVRSLRI